MSTAKILLSATRCVRVRVARTNWNDLARLVFRRHPDREWATYFRFGYRRTSWGLAISLVDLLPPASGELSHTSPIVSFSPDYISRALDERDRTALGIGFIHSHPQRFGVTPSESDDDMDSYFARLSLPYGTQQPYVSLIVNRISGGQLTFSGRAFDHGEWLPVTDLFIPGSELDRYRSSLVTSPSTSRTYRPQGVLARWATLVGPRIVERCLNATIGIVGCSGTGSPLVETLARSQIGEFVVVDGKRLSESNLERLHGSHAADIAIVPPPYKVELMARMIREINPSAKVTQIVGNALDAEVLDELLRCDLVFGCTDTLHGRAFLGDLASLFLVPAIDVGVLPMGLGGKVTSQLIDILRLGPEDSCPFCHARIPASLLNVELMSDKERNERRAAADAALERGANGAAYWNGEPPSLPSVGYLTTAAGAITAGYGLNWILGTAAMPHQRMQFDLGMPEFGFVSDTVPPRPHCSCARSKGYGDQGELSVTRPKHFPPPLILGSG